MGLKLILQLSHHSSSFLSQKQRKGKQITGATYPRLFGGFEMLNKGLLVFSLLYAELYEVKTAQTLTSYMFLGGFTPPP